MSSLLAATTLFAFAAGFGPDGHWRDAGEWIGWIDAQKESVFLTVLAVDSNEGVVDLELRNQGELPWSFRITADSLPLYRSLQEGESLRTPSRYIQAVYLAIGPKMVLESGESVRFQARMPERPGQYRYAVYAIMKRRRFLLHPVSSEVMSVLPR